jgi:hypothetical protein
LPSGESVIINRAASLTIVEIVNHVAVVVGLARIESTHTESENKSIVDIIATSRSPGPSPKCAIDLGGEGIGQRASGQHREIEEHGKRRKERRLAREKYKQTFIDGDRRTRGLLSKHYRWPIKQMATPI